MSDQQTSSILDARLWYAQHGIATIQLHHITEAGTCSCGNPGADPDHDRRQGGKHPVRNKWAESATVDPDVIRHESRYRPNANVGIVCGEKFGRFFLDVDPEAGGDASLKALEEKYGPLPPTWTTGTGSEGTHYGFLFPDFPLKNSAGKLGPGLDIRGNGGMVVAPPSVSGKGPYTMIKRVPFAPAPEWLLDLLRPPARRETPPGQRYNIGADRMDAYTRKALQGECDAITNAPDGTQNDTINAAAFNVGQLVGAGALSEADAEDALMGAARAGNHPESRARSAVRSGLDAGMAEPRRPWPPRGRPTEPPTSEKVKSGVFSNPLDVEEHFAEEPDPLGGAELPRPAPMAAEEMMPPQLAAFARSVADHLQVPIEAPAMTMLATLSATANARVWVRNHRKGWKQPLILRTLTTMRSGERKSDTVRIITRPLYEVEEGLERDHKAAVEVAGVRRDQLEAQEEELKRQVKAAKGKADEATFAELSSVRSELAKLPAEDSDPPQLMVGDATPEALGDVLSSNHERAAIILAEDALFSQIAGRYSNGVPNLGIYLSSYDEEPYRVNRIQRGFIPLKAPALVIGLLVQPHVLDNAAKIPGARDSGLMGRWIFALPQSLMGHRLIDSPPLDDTLNSRWHRTLHSIIEDLPLRPEERPYIDLSDEAHQLMRTFQAFLEPHQEEIVGRYAHMTDWTGKILGTIMRVAGLYHLAQGHRPDTSINEPTMRWAVNLGYWALTQAEYAHRAWRQAEDVPGVDWIFKWLRKKNAETFTRRDLMRSAITKQDWYSPEALDGALGELHRARWIASVTDTDSQGRAKATGAFVTNPRIFKETGRG